MKSTAEKRRELALTLAVELAANQQVQSYKGQTVVNIADMFESYLKEGKPEA